MCHYYKMKYFRDNIKINTMMNKTAFIKTCVLLLGTMGLSSCLSTDELPFEKDKQDGAVELFFSGNNATRSTTSTISPDEARNFLVTVSQGDEIVRGPQTLGSMNMRFPAGQGYKVFAESCTEADAERNNNYWGQKRFVGTSAEFGINRGETTKVTVPMSVENAAMCVFINESLANYFRHSCTITLTDPGDRNIVWTYANAGKMVDGVKQDGQIAYFNLNESNVNEQGQRIVEYKIVAVADNNTIEKTGTLALSRAKMSRLNLAYQSGFYSLTINIDQTELFVNNDLTVGPDDIIQDDGATDIDGSNDDFNVDGSDVDYDQYN